MRTVCAPDAHQMRTINNLITTHIIMSKETEQKKALARSLFMAGMEQKEIADKVGVSAQAISRWVNKEGWKEARAAKNITRPELVNKMLATIDRMLDELATSEDPLAIGSAADKLSKLSTTIERLDKKASVVDAIDVFISFGKWLEYRSQTDAEITVDFLKKLNKYQDMYIGEQITR